MELSAAILVGGGGRRFGAEPKPLAVVGGEAVIDRQLRCLRERCSAIALVSSRSEEPIAAGRDVELLIDHADGAGPLAGIARALEWSPSEWLLVVAGDLPLLTTAWVDLLAARVVHGVDLIAARVDQRPQPLAALYCRSCYDAIVTRLADGRLSPMNLFLDPPTELDAMLFDVNGVDAAAIRGFNTEAELDDIRMHVARE